MADTRSHGGPSQGAPSKDIPAQGIDSAQCRARTAQLLAEQAAALEELAAFLEREHECLAANDVAGLEAVIEERQRAVARVVRADGERAALCRRLGYEVSPGGLAALIRACDVGGALAAHWAQCTAVAARCRALNDRNGALAGARLRHVRARLATLLHGRGEAVAYGPRGLCDFGSVGRVVKIDV